MKQGIALGDRKTPCNTLFSYGFSQLNAGGISQHRILSETGVNPFTFFNLQ